jgi:DNA-binding NarL/FixJ family response regulator
MVSPNDFCPIQPVSVAIADDCPAMREGLARLVSDECDLVVTGSAATVAELQALVATRPPRVLIMELHLGEHDGLALIEDLLSSHPEMRTVIFTRQPTEVYAARCLQAGAAAYLTKTDSVAALFRAIRQAADGSTVLPRSIARHVFTPGSRAEADASGGVALPLSNRELQVFRLAGLALPTRTIAEKLGVSVKTVESHREHIKNKLSLGSHAELVARAANWLRENGG